MKFQSKMLRPSLVAAAVASALATGAASAATMSIAAGTVGGAQFTQPTFADSASASAGSSTTATTYAGVTVFYDLNGNGQLDAGEPSTTTDANGNYKLVSTKGIADVVALIPASNPSLSTVSTYTTTNSTSPAAVVLRASGAQVAAATSSPTLAAKIDITPISTEVAREAQFDGISFQTAVNTLSQRINVSATDLLLAPTKVTDATELPAILKESVIDTGRFQLASNFLSRGDTVGELRGNFDCPNISAPSYSDTAEDANSNGCSGTDLNAVTNIWQAQNYAQNLEGMPRYDYVFVIIEENESLSSLKNAAGIPYLNALLNNGSQFYDYFSTGNPSEPNYLALGGADDWGQTSDEGIPYPAITGVRQNLFNSLDAHGVSWRVYEESLWPSTASTYANPGASSWNTGTGHAWFDNPAETSIAGSDGKTYPSSVVGKKHQPAVWYADVTAQPNYLSNSRSIGGKGTDLNGNAIPYAWGSTSYGTPPANTGDWDNSLQSYATTNGVTGWWNGTAWQQDQFKQDLLNGDVANFNFIVPDQYDDGHNSDPTTGKQVGPRMDYFANQAIAKIESSSIWKDPTKRVAIVVTFDEGEASGTPLACCGWNAARGTAAPVATSSAGVFSKGTGVTGTEAFNGTAYSSTYANGNKGHGVTLFGVYTNQQQLNGAPTGHYDTDYYSHFSFVRTIQDIFGAADPGLPGTYDNRAKYTENFVLQYSTLLPELASSSNPHFDSVRAMNHVYTFPNGLNHATVQGGTTVPTATSGSTNGTGPDLYNGAVDNTNLWAVPQSVQ